jgi:dihydrodipicolinate synthase/N-acetylneuraminate lyase
MKYKISEAKEYFREKLKGIQDRLLPSFIPGELELDEKGIRHDIERLIACGAAAICTCRRLGLTIEEFERLIEMVVDRVKGSVLVGAFLNESTVKRNVEVAKICAEKGLDFIMIGPHNNFSHYDPQAEKIAYEYIKNFVEQVEIAVELYNNPKWGTAMSSRTLANLAEFKNVVALKDGTGGIAHDAENFRLFSERIVVTDPSEEYWPILIYKHHMQAALNPASICHWWQTPQNQPLNKYWELASKGNIDKALEIYWALEPLRQLTKAGPLAGFPVGTYWYKHWKYWDGLVGSTGGPLRGEYPRVSKEFRENLQKALRAEGMLLGDLEYQDRFI